MVNEQEVLLFTVLNSLLTIHTYLNIIFSLYIPPSKLFFIS